MRPTQFHHTAYFFNMVSSILCECCLFGLCNKNVDIKSTCDMQAVVTFLLIINDDSGLRPTVGGVERGECCGSGYGEEKRGGQDC